VRRPPAAKDHAWVVALISCRPLRATKLGMTRVTEIWFDQVGLFQ